MEERLGSSPDAKKFVLPKKVRCDAVAQLIGLPQVCPVEEAISHAEAAKRHAPFGHQRSAPR
jgi:hypothetical protein